MSATSRRSRNAENIKYGFLAIKSKNALENYLSKKTLTKEELEILSKASLFLEAIADGALLVSTGQPPRHNSREPMAALKVAMDPLKSLQMVMENRKIADFFQSLSSAIKEIVKGNMIFTAEISNRLTNAASFFDALYRTLLSAVSKTNKAIISIPLKNLRYGT